MVKESIRETTLAGAWYPGDPRELRDTLSDYFRAVPDDHIDGQVMGIMAPHAGYAYSGQVAAYAYKQVQGRTFDVVVVIGPSHRAYFRGVSAYGRGGYETPLGVIPIDDEFSDALMANSRVVALLPQAHGGEHSVEIQLPFLQAALGDFRLVPLVMGSQDKKTCQDLARAISATAGEKKVLIVASSDLSHYHGYDNAVKMDSLAVARLEKMNYNDFLKDMEEGVIEACGGGPTAVAMMAAEKFGARNARVLKYINSGDVAGDRQRVVGYAAAVFYKGLRAKEGREEASTPAGDTVGLTEGEKELLLHLALRAIEGRLSGKDVPQNHDVPEIMKKGRGAFVTLKKRGRLRGCIGYTETDRSLKDTIEEMAVAAAFHDPRFPPLTGAELQDIEIEISVLSPLKEVRDVDNIEVGRHGLYIVKGGRRGLLLPQVAVEYKWDRLTFLEETCRKAGLPPHAWKDGETKIYAFSADIFGTTR